MDVEGKNVVVTGGASGIGRGIVGALADAGAAGIVVADVDEKQGQEVVGQLEERGVKAFFTRCDVSSEAAVEELADFAWSKLGSVEIVFNNAGVTASGDPLSATESDTRWEFDVNAFGVINGTRVFARRFIAAGIRGWICNTSSENAFAAPYPDVAGYVATKHASLGYSDAIRTQFGDKVGVSVLCPGPVTTSVWNSGRVRPDRYGGPTTGNPLNEKFLADAGLDPALVGKMAVDGIRAEDFYILTHPENLESVRKRYEEIKACVVRQFPDYTPS